MAAIVVDMIFISFINIVFATDSQHFHLLEICSLCVVDTNLKSVASFVVGLNSAKKLKFFLFQQG